MSKPTCDDVAHLIELHAAGECGPEEEKAVRAHIATCADCSHALDEARQVQGLLDVHFGQEAALSRLGERLKAETRRSRAAPPWIISLRRFAAVAALLLVTFGLGLLMMPNAPASALGLQISLEGPLVLGLQIPEVDRSKPAKVAMGFPEAKAMHEAMHEAKRTGKWPLPPRIDMDLVVRNSGPTPIELELGGRGFRCEIELSGPGAVRRHAPPRPEYVPFPPSKETIGPGGQVKLRLERLAVQRGEQVWYLYPMVPGEYEIRVHLAATARRLGKEEKVRLTTPPRPLRLR
jgi:hypothetical protein